MKRTILLILVGFAFPFLFQSIAYSLTCNWTGAGANSNWSNSDNWQDCGGGVPSSTDSVNFAFDFGTADSTIDAGFAGSIDSFSVTAGYPGTITQSRSLTLSGFYQQTFGTFTGGSSALTIAGAITIGGGTFNAPSGTMSIGGDFSSVGGTFNHNSGTVSFNGTSDQTLDSSSQNFNNVTINKSAGVLSLLNNNLTALGTITITNGTFSIAGLNVSMAALSNDATFQLQGGETVTITGGMDTNSGTVAYVGTGTYASLAAGNSYYSVTFNGSGGSWTHTGTLDVNGNLTITQGTLISGGQNITLAGNWSNSGTYTSGSNTVTLDGTSQTISGATTFNNLTKNVTSAATLTFPASTTNVIAGTLTLTGASGNLLSLRSSSTGTQSSINPQGTRTVQYLDVKDNNNINSTAISCSTGCTDSGNNTNWTFPPSGPVVTITVEGGNTVTVGSAGAVITLEGSTTLTNPSYLWTSSNPSVGSISNATEATAYLNIVPNPPTTTLTITLTVTGTSASIGVLPDIGSEVLAAITTDSTTTDILINGTGPIAGGGCQLNPKGNSKIGFYLFSWMIFWGIFPLVIQKISDKNVGKH